MSNTNAHAQPYTVLVVTNAVPPSSVAGSGILCSVTEMHAGCPTPTSVPVSSEGPLQTVKLSSLWEPVGAPGWRWWQDGGTSAALWYSSAWPFLSEHGRWTLAVFWRGSCCGFAATVTQTNITHVNNTLCVCVSVCSNSEVSSPPCGTEKNNKHRVCSLWWATTVLHLDCLRLSYAELDIWPYCQVLWTLIPPRGFVSSLDASWFLAAVCVDEQLNSYINKTFRPQTLCLFQSNQHRKYWRILLLNMAKLY